MVNRDDRYDLIKPMLEKGNVQSFNDIFKYIPKTVVAINMGKKVDRFTEIMNRVEKFKLEEVFAVAKLCEVDDSEMLQLVYKEYIKQKRKKK